MLTQTKVTLKVKTILPILHLRNSTKNIPGIFHQTKKKKFPNSKVKNLNLLEVSIGLLLDMYRKLKTKDNVEVAGHFLPLLLWNLLNLFLQEICNYCLNNKPTIVLPLMEAMDVVEDIQVQLLIISKITEFAQKVVILMLLEIKHAKDLHAQKFLSELKELVTQVDLLALLKPIMINNHFPFVIRLVDGNIMLQEFWKIVNVLPVVAIVPYLLDILIATGSSKILGDKTGVNLDISDLKLPITHVDFWAKLSLHTIDFKN